MDNTRIKDLPDFKGSTGLVALDSSLYGTGKVPLPRLAQMMGVQGGGTVDPAVLDGKVDKVTGATENDIAVFDANGNLVDSGKTISELNITDASGDIYWGDLSTTWEDIVRAQAQGKIVYLRLDIAGMFCLTAGPIKNVVPRFDATFKAMDKVKELRKQTFMNALGSINDALTEHGYEVLTEQDIDDLLDGKMPIERYNEVTVSMGQEPVDDAGYREALEVSCPWLTVADVDLDEFLDDFVESMRSNPLVNNIAVDLSFNTAELGLGALGYDESILNSVRIGLGLNYSADLPLPTPTYVALGLPFIMCIPVEIEGLPIPGMGTVNLLDMLFEGQYDQIEQAIEENPDDPQLQLIAGIKNALIGDGDALFGLALGMSITKKDEYDPPGLVLDLNGTQWNREIDIDSLLENAQLPNGLDASDLYDTVQSMIIQYTGLDIDIGEIVEMINNIKISISPRHTFRTVMQLINAGWDINLVSFHSEYEDPTQVLIPGHPGYYGMGIEFSALVPVESFADGYEAKRDVVENNPDTGTVGSGAVRYSYSVITCKDSGDVVFLNRQRDGYFRRAIKIVDDMPFRDLYAAACEGCMGYYGSVGHIGWFELVPREIDDTDVVFITSLNSDDPVTLIACAARYDAVDDGLKQAVEDNDEQDDPENPVIDIVGEFYAFGDKVYVDPSQYAETPELLAALLHYWMDVLWQPMEVYVPGWGWGRDRGRERVVYYNTWNHYIGDDVAGSASELDTVLDTEFYAGYSAITTYPDDSGYGERIKWFKRGIVCNVRLTGDDGDLHYELRNIDGLEGTVYEYWVDEIDGEPVQQRYDGNVYDCLYSALNFVEPGILPMYMQLPNGESLPLVEIERGENPCLYFAKVKDGELHEAKLTLSYDCSTDVIVSPPRPLETAWQIADEVTPVQEDEDYVLNVQHKCIHIIHLSNTTPSLTIVPDSENRPLSGEPMQVKVIVMKDAGTGTTDLIIPGTFVGINGQYTLNPDKAYILEVTGPIASFRETELPQSPQHPNGGIQ